MVSKKKNLFVCEDGLEISALLDHHLSPLGKARDEAEASTGHHSARLVMRRRPLLVTHWKQLTSWLLLEMSECDFVTSPGGILGQVWYLIVLIPDLCRLSYFYYIFTPMKSLKIVYQRHCPRTFQINAIMTIIEDFQKICLP